MYENYKILVVDDDQLLNQIICAHLEQEGFLTVSAISLNQAITEIERDQNIDMVLLDFQLGDGNGIDFLKYNESFHYIDRSPVIMISASDRAEFLETCFELGASDYIIKPINFNLLSLKSKSLIQSEKLKKLINKQNEELSKYKNDSLREEAMAKFTYEYLVRQGSDKVPGVSIWLQPSAAFSGDAVLVKTSPTGDLYMIMADATGHGLSAAITMMPVVTTFDSMVAKGFHLQSIMSEINRKLVANTPDDRFVAAIGIEINKINRELLVWNGGMPSIYVLDDSGIAHVFKSTHMALGILEDDAFDAGVQELILGEGSRLFSCSDGMIEQVNDNGEPFSKNRLTALLQKNTRNLLANIIDAFGNYVGNAVRSDDISMFLIDVDEYYASTTQNNMEIDSGLYRDNGKFSWETQLCGDRLRTCEFIPLVQHVLQHMEINQALSQKVFIVASEMLNNAIDHGVLELSSSLKEQDNGFWKYHQERERRLANVDSESYVNVILTCENKQGVTEIFIRVKDSGKGYQVISPTGFSELAHSGRGLQLIHRLSRRVYIEPPGNVIEAILQ